MVGRTEKGAQGVSVGGSGCWLTLERQFTQWLHFRSSFEQRVRHIGTLEQESKGHSAETRANDHDSGLVVIDSGLHEGNDRRVWMRVLLSG